MLFAGLQAQPVGLVAARIDRHAHQPPRHRPLHRIRSGHIGRVRPAITHRHARTAESSRRRCPPPSRPVPSTASTPAGRRAQFRRPWLACSAAIAPVKSMRCPRVPGYWNTAPNTASASRSAGSADDDLDPQRLRRGFSSPRCSADGTPDRRRTPSPSISLTRCAIAIASAGRSPFIQQRGVGDRQARQIADHRLIVQQRLKPALAEISGWYGV